MEDRRFWYVLISLLRIDLILVKKFGIFEMERINFEFGSGMVKVMKRSVKFQIINEIEITQNRT